MAASTCRKCKRIILWLVNKSSILDRLAKGEKATKVASEFGNGNSTVTDLKKNKSRIWSFISYVSSMKSLSVCSKERKIMRLAYDEKVDEGAYLWYRLQGLFWGKEAQLFHQQIYGDNPLSSFQASTGWQWRFCQHACMYPLWWHNCMYKLIFHLSEIVLAPTISDMWGSTVPGTLYNYVLKARIDNGVRPYESRRQSSKGRLALYL